MVRFHTKRQRKPVWRRALPLVTFVAVLSLSAMVMHYSSLGGEWEAVDTRFTLCGERSSKGCVIDGDTIMIGERKIRMTGYNAPELAGECGAEIRLARRSRNALLDWLNDGSFDMSGSDDPPYDQYGRELRELKRGDTLLADHMIKQSLAQESGWGFTRGGWCS